MSVKGDIPSFADRIATEEFLMPPTSQNPAAPVFGPAAVRPGGSMKSAEVAEFVFDSHRFVKRLTGAGMDERVAEVLADEQVALLTGNLATRTALADTGAGLQKDLKATETGLRKDLKAMEAGLRKELQAMEAGLRKDLKATETELRKDLKATENQIRADLERRLAEVRADLTKWMFGALMVQAALIVALIKLLP